MIQRIRAVYRNGHLVPDHDLNLPEESVVEITIDETAVSAPQVTDPVERSLRTKALLEKMKSNPLPPNSPKFTREQLHERR